MICLQNNYIKVFMYVANKSPFVCNLFVIFHVLKRYFVHVVEFFQRK